MTPSCHAFAALRDLKFVRSRAGPRKHAVPTNSGSKQSSVKACLRMAQDLVRGTETTSCLQSAIAQLFREPGYVLVEPGKNLLAVRVADRDRTDACADGPHCHLMEIDTRGIGRRCPSR